MLQGCVDYGLTLSLIGEQPDSLASRATRLLAICLTKLLAIQYWRYSRQAKAAKSSRTVDRLTTHTLITSSLIELINLSKTVRTGIIISLLIEWY